MRWFVGKTTAKQLGARGGCCNFSCVAAVLCSPKEAVGHWACTADANLSFFKKCYYYFPFLMAKYCLRAIGR